jgi:hypothetical protein
MIGAELRFKAVCRMPKRCGHHPRICYDHIEGLPLASIRSAQARPLGLDRDCGSADVHIRISYSTVTDLARLRG